jgi:hypothetical protein
VSSGSITRRIELLEARPVLRVVPPEPVAIDQPADVLALLEEQVNAVRADPVGEPSEKARTLGFLASLALRAMEARDLTARLEAVERVLKLREKAVEPNGKKKQWR